MNFLQRIEEKRRWRKAKRLIAGLLLIGAAYLATGFYDGDQVLVNDTYTVQPGDTLRGISEMFLEKNTGGRRYILEFESGIKELNPWLIENDALIHPGDEIQINYWTKRGGEVDAE